MHVEEDRLTVETAPEQQGKSTVRCDEARVVGLYATVRSKGWPAIGAQENRGTWGAATYVSGHLTPASAGSSATVAGRRGKVLIFHPDRTGERLEARVVLATAALEYVKFISRNNNLTKAFKSLAKVRYRLNEAGRIGDAHAVAKALGELSWDPLESTCRHASLSIL